MCCIVLAGMPQISLKASRAVKRSVACPQAARTSRATTAMMAAQTTAAREQCTVRLVAAHIVHDITSKGQTRCQTSWAASWHSALRTVALFGQSDLTQDWKADSAQQVASVASQRELKMMMKSGAVMKL